MVPCSSRPQGLLGLQEGRAVYQVPDQSGRRIVITGANSGTGKEATKRLAAAGASIVMAVRTPNKGESAREEILREVPGADLAIERIDLADLASVAAFADRLNSDDRPIDTLVNNAGVMMPPQREETADGFELQFGSNFLGPFALTNLLLPALLRSSSPRVATMSSSAANTGRINWEDPNWRMSYRPMAAYCQSKLADAVMGAHLAGLSRNNGWGLLSTLAHPGHTRTNLQTVGPNLGTGSTDRSLVYRVVPSMDVVQGTEPLLHAATDPQARPGSYYGPRWFMIGDTHLARVPRSVREVDSTRLWNLAERMTGVSTPLL